MKKDFKYTIRNKKGLIITQTIVTFGSEEYPFPENWEESPLFQRSMMNFKDEFLHENFDVEISEDTEFNIKDDTTTGAIIGKLMEHMANIQNTPNPLTGEPMDMDLSDIGNAIGMEVQKAIQEGKGSIDDFMNGLKHGISIIDGTHG
jgi:hypothetical protein